MLQVVRRTSRMFLFLLSVLMVTAVLADKSKDLKISEIGDTFTFKCNNGLNWRLPHTASFTDKPELKLEYRNTQSGEYLCNSEKQNVTLYVKFRTCDNCIELDAMTATGIVLGDVVATVMIAFAVYFIASQNRVIPSNNNRNKASDRQNLIPNQHTDTYMPLSQGHSSEYSQLERRRKK